MDSLQLTHDSLSLDRMLVNKIIDTITIDSIFIVLVTALMGNQHSIVEQLYPGCDPSLFTFILDEDEDILEKLLLLLDEDEDQRKEQKEHWDRCRIDWKEHVMKSIHEDSFSSKYHMSYHAFCYLVDFLRPSLTRMSSRCRATEFVFPEIIAAVGIRWLAGESYLSLMDIMNISKTEVYACRDQFIDTILNSDELSIKLPQTDEEWESVRAEFAAKSRDGIFGGCVGAIDGFSSPPTNLHLLNQVVSHLHITLDIIVCMA